MGVQYQQSYHVGLRFALFDTHVRMVAEKVDGLRLTLFAFAQVHNGLVEGAGAHFFR